MISLIGNLVLVYIFALIFTAGIFTLFTPGNSTKKLVLSLLSASILIALYLWGSTLDFKYYTIAFSVIILLNFINQVRHDAKKRKLA